MALADIPLQWSAATTQHALAAFIEDAQARTEQFKQGATRVPSYVNSNYYGALGVLESLHTQGQAGRRRFCEWGSGLGVVCGLASMIGFEATGIEINPGLHQAALALARDYQLSTSLYEGSYIPHGAFIDAVDEFRLESSPGFSPFEFDLIYAFPWPAEEALLPRLFERFAAVGAQLLTYHGGGQFRLRGKVDPHA